MIWKCETGRGVMMMYRYDSRTGFLVVLAPSELVKDRSLSAVLIGGLNCTNHMPGVGGSRNR